MRAPVFVGPGDRVTEIGRAFGTPVVVKGWTWLPFFEAGVAAFLAWELGNRRPDLSVGARWRIAVLATPVWLGSEWAHNFAHAAVAARIGKPMDAIRILWGTPVVVYHDLEEAGVTPREHILRALGGPAFNALLVPPGLIARRRTTPGTPAGEIARAAFAANLFLCTASLLPLPGIDGGPVLKWSLVSRGRSPAEADEIVRKVDLVLAPVLALAAWRLWRRGRRFLGALMGMFTALSALFGLGLLRER